MRMLEAARMISMRIQMGRRRSLRGEHGFLYLAPRETREQVVPIESNIKNLRAVQIYRKKIQAIGTQRTVKSGTYTGKCAHARSRPRIVHFWSASERVNLVNMLCHFSISFTRLAPTFAVSLSAFVGCGSRHAKKPTMIAALQCVHK